MTHLLLFILFILLILLFLVVLVFLVVIIFIFILFSPPPLSPLLLILLVAIIFHVFCSLFLPLHAPLRELFHHFEELLTIVLQEVIGDSQDITGAYRSRDVNEAFQTEEMKRKEKME
jgi:hypothetical protein